MLPEDEKALTIARRTRKNLDFMYASKAKGDDVEEFTHLLNSMLGMLICLREEYFKERCVTWKDVEQRGLKSVYITSSPPTQESPNLKQHKNFSQLITKARHAFSHNNFDLQGDDQRRITGVLVWNIEVGKENKAENRTWEASISEQQLRNLAYLFIDYVEHNVGGKTV